VTPTLAVRSCRAPTTSGAQSPLRLDVLDAFGPLASMHAALDRAGVGGPCGLVVRFENATPSQVEAAIAIARRRFPVLQMGLTWQNDRAVLETLTMDGGGRELWAYALRADGDGVWLTARWRHAIADGHSMLRFLKTVHAVLGGGPMPGFAPQCHPKARPQTVARWLPGFLAQQCRQYARLDLPAPPPAAGTTWAATSPETRDLVLGAASESCGGFIGPLAAAAANSLVSSRVGKRERPVLLNIPILRDDLQAVGGFGFGVGSVMFSVWPSGGDMAGLSQDIAGRVQRQANLGWDANLDRFLGHDPRRHHRFAAIRARGRRDPAITVSWKGRHTLGERLRHAACFADTAALHISAHADECGLSISITSRQSGVQRANLLEDMLTRLGVRSGSMFQLDDLFQHSESHASGPVIERAR
jgi:hypothetical protein